LAASVAAALAAAAAPIADELERQVAEEEALGLHPGAQEGTHRPLVVTELDPMLDGREGETAAASTPETPHDPINAHRFARLVAAELKAGLLPDDARASALAALGERDAAAAAIFLPPPPPMTRSRFLAHVHRLTATLADAQEGSDNQEAA
jgi:hypothetical protein